MERGLSSNEGWCKGTHVQEVLPLEEIVDTADYTAYNTMQWRWACEAAKLVQDACEKGCCAGSSALRS